MMQIQKYTFHSVLSNSSFKKFLLYKLIVAKVESTTNKQKRVYYAKNRKKMRTHAYLAVVLATLFVNFSDARSLYERRSGTQTAADTTICAALTGGDAATPLNAASKPLKPEGALDKPPPYFSSTEVGQDN
jgi:hypothetical protein